MARRELEFKWQVPHDVLALLSADLKVGRHELQIDRVFARSNNDVLRPVEGVVVARTRSWPEDSKPTRLTVKRRRQSNLDKDEAELDVESESGAAEVLVLLGLHELLTIRKRRATVALETDVTISLDEVEGLGAFVELELMAPPANVSLSSVLADLRTRWPSIADILARPGVRTVEAGYDTLLLAATL